MVSLVELLEMRMGIVIMSVRDMVGVVHPGIVIIFVHMWKHVLSGEWVISVLKLSMLLHVLLVWVSVRVVLQHWELLMMITMVVLAKLDVRVQSKMVLYAYLFDMLWLVYIDHSSCSVLISIIMIWIMVNDMLRTSQQTFIYICKLWLMVFMVHMCHKLMSIIIIEMVCLLMMWLVLEQAIEVCLVFIFILGLVSA